jgi:hypothetical protein
MQTGYNGKVTSAMDGFLKDKWRKLRIGRALEAARSLSRQAERTRVLVLPQREAARARNCEFGLGRPTGRTWGIFGSHGLAYSHRAGSIALGWLGVCEIREFQTLGLRKMPWVSLSLAGKRMFQVLGLHEFLGGTKCTNASLSLAYIFPSRELHLFQLRRACTLAHLTS